MHGASAPKTIDRGHADTNATVNADLSQYVELTTQMYKQKKDISGQNNMPPPSCVLHVVVARFYDCLTHVTFAFVWRNRRYSQQI